MQAPRTARPKGRPTISDRKVEVRLDEKTYQWLGSMAAMTGESQSWVVRQVISDWFYRMNDRPTNQEED